MADTFGIPPLREMSLDALNNLVWKLNEELTRIGQAVDDVLRGNRTFKGDVDMGSYRVSNAANAEAADDCVTLGQLEDEVGLILRRWTERETSEGTGTTGGGGSGGGATSAGPDFEDVVEELLDDVADTAIAYGADDGAGNIDLTSDADKAALTSTSLVFNDGGASDLDFRVEGDNLPNLFLLDASADRIFVSDAATGGTPPADPTGGYSTGTLMAVVNNSAGGDDAILALISDATSGLSQIHFGDSGDANVGMISYDNGSNVMTLTAAATSILSVGAGGVVINAAGTSTLDTRIEGDTLPNLLLVDASADLVYITDAATEGTPPTAPTGGYTAGTLAVIQNNSSTLDNAGLALIGGTSASSYVDFGDSGDANSGSIVYNHPLDTMFFIAGANTVASLSGSAVTINDDGDDVDFRVEGDNATSLLFADGGNDRIGVNEATPACRLHVTESATDAALPVLLLDQSDVDEPFVKLIGTAAAETLTNSIVAAADVTTATVAGYVKIEVQDDGDQIADQDYFLAVYTLE